MHITEGRGKNAIHVSKNFKLVSHYFITFYLRVKISNRELLQSKIIMQNQVDELRKQLAESEDQWAELKDQRNAALIVL